MQNIATCLSVFNEYDLVSRLRKKIKPAMKQKISVFALTTFLPSNCLSLTICNLSKIHGILCLK